MGRLYRWHSGIPYLLDLRDRHVWFVHWCRTRLDNLSGDRVRRRVVVALSAFVDMVLSLIISIWLAAERGQGLKRQIRSWVLRAAFNVRKDGSDSF